MLNMSALPPGSFGMVTAGTYSAAKRRCPKYQGKQGSIYLDRASQNEE